MRAAPAAKGVWIGDTIEIALIIDHGCRIYSEQVFELAGVVPTRGVLSDGIKSFIQNWITHAGTPSALWVVSFSERPSGGWVGSLERVALDELGKNPTDELHSLAAELIDQGICKPTEPDA